MARRRRRRSDQAETYKVQRDFNRLSLTELLDEDISLYRPMRSRAVELLEVEDRRLFDPEDVYRPARSLLYSHSADVVEEGERRGESRPLPKGRAYSIPAKSPSRRFARQARAHFVFREPRQVAVCVRRKARREVLHALKRLNGGARRHRNYQSKIGC